MLNAKPKPDGPEPNDTPGNAGEKLDEILDKYGKNKGAGTTVAGTRPAEYRPPTPSYYETREIQSSSFNAQNLQNVVDEIKVIEDGIKNIIASRTNKVVEEKIPVEKQRPVRYNIVDKALVSLGFKEQEMETFTDYDIVKKEVPRKPDEVMITEFRGMIDKYINSLKGLNEGLRDTVLEVD
ncbi:MAG: hypothetical protein ACOCW9_00295, partial [Thermodesulfobacteriota bacterium]